MLRDNYSSLINIRDAFRKAGGRSIVGKGQSKFNELDTPITQYFRLLFDFSTDYGLLGSAIDLISNEDENKYGADPLIDGEGQLKADIGTDGRIKSQNSDAFSIFDKGASLKQNTAFNYLMLNNEFERAALLKQFINLLSNINTYSPWYFQEISGLDAALSRPEYTSNDFKVVTDERKSITIKCLPDAHDNRIGKLLDMYRTICFSHRLNKVIVPSNLRQFDLSIALVSTPILNMHNDKTYISGSATTGSIDKVDEYHNSDHYVTSHKIFTLHNCEINIDSNATPFGTISNADGFQPNYIIKIDFDRIYEERYDEYTSTVISDVIEWDINYTLNRRNTTKYLEDIHDMAGDTNNRIHLFSDKSFSDPSQLLNNIPEKTKYGDELLSDVKKSISTTRKLSLGNIHKDYLKQAMNWLGDTIKDTANIKPVRNRVIGSNLYTNAQPSAADRFGRHVQGVTNPEKKLKNLYKGWSSRVSR